jgi:hypothetical protein
MDRLRLIGAATVLVLPAGLFALNAFISFQERGIVEPFDIPGAVAFATFAAMVLRGSRLALLGGSALAAVYLVTAAAGGVITIVAYWIFTIVGTLQALPLTGETRTSSAV